MLIEKNYHTLICQGATLYIDKATFTGGNYVSTVNLLEMECISKITSKKPSEIIVTGKFTPDKAGFYRTLIYSMSGQKQTITIDGLEFSGYALENGETVIDSDSFLGTFTYKFKKVT